MDITEEVLFAELDELMFQKHENNFIVDIGASYNSHFLKYPCRGILFDNDPWKIMNIPANNLYERINRKITPDNVVSTLDEFDTPKNFLALNLDIDSYDLFVLINLLKEFQPKIIISEINEKIPPPINFSVKYDDTWKWQVNHFYGYSISCLNLVLKHFNYHVHKLTFANIILLKGNEEDKIQDLTQFYKEGYVNAKGRKDFFTWNTNVEHWQDLKPDILEKEIKEFFKKYENNLVIGEECEELIKKYLNE